MHYTLNTTKEYHTQGLKTLGWELTVCNALYPPESPCRKILKNADSYGHLLYRYLNRFIPMGNVKNIIEVGGGYGYLMQAFLHHKPHLNVSMLDISPFLLQKQREHLKDDAIAYILQDFLDADGSYLRGFDMAICNENLGDFPTAINVSADIFKDSRYDLPPPFLKIRDIFDRYGLKTPDQELFNFNIGAIEALEKLCYAAIPYIFLSEHSCEASAPTAYTPYLQIQSSGNPEKIALQGHDEYTVKFSYLADVANYHGYDVVRGQIVDFIEPNFSDRALAALRSTFSANDEYEIIRQFIHDLYKYEYLILIRKEGPI